MTAPSLLICALPEHQRLVTQLQDHLRQRGLTLTHTLVATAVNQQMLADAAAILVVITPATLQHPAIAALYREALHRQKTVVPLICKPSRHMPDELQSVQWIDFAHSFDAGWQQLLLLLETLGIARWPIPSHPIFDKELVHIRCRTGQLPADWIFHYLPRTRRYRLSAGALRAALVILLVSAVACVVTHFSLPVLVVGIVTTCVVTALLSQGTHVFGPSDPLVVITPEGWLQAHNGHITGFAFTEIAQIQATPVDTAERVRLTLMLADQQTPVQFDILPYFNNGLIASEIVAAYQRYSEQQVAPPAPPQIFISYSHNDAAFVDGFERNLRREGYATWLDRQSLQGGSRWETEIRKALDHAAAIVVVLSPDAARSHEVRREYNYALEQGKPVVAVLARKTPAIPVTLRVHVAGDGSIHPAMGQAYAIAALDKQGIHPQTSALTFRMNPLLTIGHAFSGNLPAGMYLFRGKIPRDYAGAFFILLAILLVIVVLSARSSSDFVSAGIAAICIVSALFLLGTSRRRLRSIPPFVIARPDGIIFYPPNFTPLIPHELAYQQASWLDVNTKRATTIIRYMPKGRQRAIEISLPASLFSEHRAIGARIAAEYQQYRASQPN